MKQEVIHELSAKELQDKLILERGNLVKLKLNHAVSPIENPMKIRITRRGIAMIHTELTDRMRSEKVKK